MIRFAHINIVTDDWKKLADFYIQVLGCKPLPPERDLQGGWLDQATGIRQAHIRGIHLALPGCEENLPTLEIFQYDSNMENSNPVTNRKGLGHLAFRVDDVEASLQRLLENGGSQLGKMVSVRVENAGQVTFVYTRDIDGNIIELQKWD